MAEIEDAMADTEGTMAETEDAVTDVEDTLAAIAYGEGPVLEALTDMNLSTLEKSGLDEKTYTMVRISALIALGAPPVSYAMSLDAAAETLEVEELQGMLIALAPVVGSARTAAAASNLLDVFFVEAEDEVADQANAETSEEATDDADANLAVVALEESAVVATEQVRGEESEIDERELEMV